MNIETAKIERTKDSYIVTDIDDMYIVVDADQVAKIFTRTDGVEEHEVIILLATIKMSRIIISATDGARYRKVNDEVATKAIIKLLGYYPVENLISILEELKYYQIKEVLESNSPIRELESYL